MSDLDELRKRLLEIGPDSGGDVTTAYNAVLADMKSGELEVILPELIAPYPDQQVNLDEARNWVCVHAWRLLRKLHSANGLKNMLLVADHPDDHLAYGEFAESAAAGGAKAASLLLPLVTSNSASDTQRILAVKGLVAIAKEQADLRSTVIVALRDLIAGDSDPGGDINGFAAEGLMALGADCSKLIEEAYLAGKIQVGALRAQALGAHFGFEA